MTLVHLPSYQLLLKALKKASEISQRPLACGAEDDLNEPFVRLLMLVKAVNEENVLVKEVGEEPKF